MQPTTQRIVREAFATAILGIDPDDDNRPDSPWHRVRSINDVKGPAIRTFLVRFLPGAPVEDGLYGDGWEQEAECQIWTGYGGLEDDEDGPTIDDDGRQLYCTLVDIRDPVTNGLLPVKWLGWAYEDDTPGAVHGYHRFTVRYLVADVTNP